jgi:hypothetical protein
MPVHVKTREQWEAEMRGVGPNDPNDYVELAKRFEHVSRNRVMYLDYGAAKPPEWASTAARVITGQLKTDELKVIYTDPYVIEATMWYYNHVAQPSKHPSGMPCDVCHRFIVEHVVDPDVVHNVMHDSFDDHDINITVSLDMLANRYAGSQWDADQVRRILCAVKDGTFRTDRRVIEPPHKCVLE